MLLGAALTGLAATVARVAGIALIGLGVACWPGPPTVGMLIYSATVAVYLALLGLAGGSAGILLWPAVALPRRAVGLPRPLLGEGQVTA